METVVKTKSALKIAVVVLLFFVAAAAAFAAGGFSVKEKTYSWMRVDCNDGTYKVFGEPTRKELLQCLTQNQWKAIARKVCINNTVSSNPNISPPNFSGVKSMNVGSECKPASRPLSAPTSRPLSMPGNNEPGVLTVSEIVQPNPAKDLVVVGEKNVKVFSFKLEAENEPIKLRTLTLQTTGQFELSSLKNVRLYLANTPNPFATLNGAGAVNPQQRMVSEYTWSAADNILPDIIRPGSPVVVNVVVEILPAGQARIGDNFHFNFYSRTISGGSFITAVGINSGKTLTFSQGVKFGVYNTRKDFMVVPFIVKIENSAPPSGISAVQAVIVGTQIGRYKIINAGNATVKPRQVFIEDLGSHAVGLAAYRLTLSSQNASDFTNIVAVSSSKDLHFTILAYNNIDGGAYRYATVSVRDSSGLKLGDSFMLSMLPWNTWFVVSEKNLGYDGNKNGRLTDELMFPGKSPDGALGKIVKQ